MNLSFNHPLEIPPNVLGDQLIINLNQSKSLISYSTDIFSTINSKKLSDSSTTISQLYPKQLSQDLET